VNILLFTEDTTSLLWKLFSAGNGNTNSTMPQLEPGKLFLWEDDATQAFVL